jgi:hypothetical protein
MTSVLVIGRAWELDPATRVWGTGGWRSPEEREALDWLTLVRLLGWRVTTATAPGGDRPDVCIVAADPADGHDGAAVLLEWARAGTTVVLPHAYAAPELAQGLAAGPAAEGRAIRWVAPNDPRAWNASRPVRHHVLVPGPGWDALAEIEGRVAVAARRDGAGTVVVVGFDPSSARDASGCAGALLVHLLTRTAPSPVAWLDLSNTMVLRMDDPGGAQNVYSREWRYPKLTSAQWGDVGRALAPRRGRISLAYSAGFVDDGDARRGRLLVGGVETERVLGRVHPSPLARYEDLAGHAPGAVYDYEDEHAGIAQLVAAGTAGVELHGYTHVHPDRTSWAEAPDRYESSSWYRELGPGAADVLAALDPEEHPLALGCAAIERWFGRRPTTLVCPGEEWTDAALETALDLDVSLVGSYYLALRHEGRFCWSTHVCAPYLDEPDASWFDSGLPVVGYMHDRDLAVNGAGWLDEWLGTWEALGAERFVDYAYLAALLSSPVEVREGDGGWEVVVPGDGVPGTVRVGLRTAPSGRAVTAEYAPAQPPARS